MLMKPRCSVLHEPGRAAETQSYVWVYCTGKYADPHNPLRLPANASELAPSGILSPGSRVISMWMATPATIERLM